MSPDTKPLLQLACRTAARIIHNPILAEEAGERAVHRFVLAMLAGQIPRQPEAWIRTVAKRSACAMLRSGWSRMLPLREDDSLPAESHGKPRPNADEVRSLLRGALTPRQRDALDAALTCRTTSDAARCCGMQPRDFRRYLGAITRRAREQLAQPSPEAAHAG